MQASTLEDLKSRLKICHELQETYITLTHRLAEDFLADYLLNYLTKRENLQKIIDSFLVCLEDTSQQQELHNEELFVVLDNYLQRWSGAIRKLENNLAVCTPNSDDRLKIEVQFATSIDWLPYRPKTIEIKGVQNYKGVASIISLAESFRRNKIEHIRHITIKTVFTLAHITQVESTFTITMDEDYVFWSHQAIKYTLTARFVIKKIEALKPQKVPIIAAFLLVATNLLHDARFDKDILKRSYLANKPLTLELKFTIDSSFPTLRKKFPTIVFNSAAS